MGAPREPRKGGRPDRDIYEVVGYDGRGQPVRLIDRAMEVYALGHGDRDVAARCGVHLETIRSWLREGSGLAADLVAGRREWSSLTKHERKVHTFAGRAVAAETEGKLYLRGLAESLARGGVQRVIETVKVNEKGETIESSRRTESTLPDGAMIRWILARRWRDEYGDRISVEASGPDGGPIQVEVDSVFDRLMGEFDRIAEAGRETDAVLAPHQEPAGDAEDVPA